MKNKYAAKSTPFSTSGGGTEVVSKGKKNGYHSEKLHAKWDKLRAEAKARQREYDSLTIPEKIARAKSRRGESKREIARLEKLQAASKK